MIIEYRARLNDGKTTPGGLNMIREYRARLNNGRTILVKENEYTYDESITTTSPKIIVDIMRSVFSIHTEADEQVYIAVINGHGDVIGFVKVSSGGINSSVVPVREILRDVLLLGGTSFILVHNHPSGHSEPSTEDINTAKMLERAADIVGISFYDSIIIGNGYTSLKSLGY